MKKPIKPTKPSEKYYPGSVVIKYPIRHIDLCTLSLINNGLLTINGFGSLVCSKICDNPYFDKEKVTYNEKLEKYNQEMINYRAHIEAQRIHKEEQERVKNEQRMIKEKQKVVAKEEKKRESELQTLNALLEKYSHLPEMQEKIKLIG